uniref:Uncharacterized protein n=1 Tax=Anguilla anguilla TaxID=7936 RepID=A0A0E9RTQ2_ANGAN
MNQSQGPFSSVSTNLPWPSNLRTKTPIKYARVLGYFHRSDDGIFSSFSYL